MADVTGKAFLSLDGLGKKADSSLAKVGGRVDITRRIKDLLVSLSFTDATLKNTGKAPWLHDALVTVEKKVNSTFAGDTSVTVGYDLGLKNEGAFAIVQSDSTTLEKDLSLKASWFQRGNVVRGEGVLKLDARNTLWGTVTANDNRNVVNSTYINLKEREAFIIDPFIHPVVTNAVGYRLETHGYTIEPSFDLNRNAGYFAVSKDYKGNTLKAAYAAKEEVALFEVGRKTWAWQDLPIVKFYAKAPLRTPGANLSLGFIVDKTLYL